MTKATPRGRRIMIVSIAVIDGDDDKHGDCVDYHYHYQLCCHCYHYENYGKDYIDDVYTEYEDDYHDGQGW